MTKATTTIHDRIMHETAHYLRGLGIEPEVNLRTSQIEFNLGDNSWEIVQSGLRDHLMEVVSRLPGSDSG